MHKIQKLINLAAIVVILIFLIKLNNKVQKIDGKVFMYNQVARAILKGEELTESQLRLLNQLVKIQMSADEQYTPLCLVKAYSAIYGFLHTNDLFNQIEASHLDFQNVDSCLNYFSVLLYKARNLQIPQKAKVISIFESLQQKEIQRKYAQKKESQSICVFYTTFNSEKVIKDQIAAINRQTFSKYYVEINDRGSTDNTPMIASYKLKEIYGDDQAKAKIFLKTNTEEGIFTALKRFISNCPVHSIIVVVGDNDTFLGSNGLETIDRVFATQGLDVAVFSALETTHLNLELYNQKELRSVKAPILAFREKIFQREDKLLKFEKQTVFQPFWRTWLANHLLYLRDTSKLKLKIVNQAFVFRSSPKNTTELAPSQQLSSRYDALQ